MTDHKSTKPSDAIQKLKDKEPEANNESARTNELLASRAAPTGEDALVKASLEANDPSKTRNAYTSEKFGFNEDLAADDDKEVPTKKRVVSDKK